MGGAVNQVPMAWKEDGSFDAMICVDLILSARTFASSAKIQAYATKPQPFGRHANTNPPCCGSIAKHGGESALRLST